MDTKIIGNKIAKARKEKNISQSELAEQLFLSPQAVGKWERGESIPDIITVNRLANILGVNLNYFSDNSQLSVNNVALTPPVLQEEKKKLSWNMSNGNWVDADFSGLKNLHEKFGSSNMQRCKFIGSDLSGLLLRSNYINKCDFSRSDLGSSQVQNAHLVNSIFDSCSLKEADFSGSHIKGCDFSNTDFTGATIQTGGFEKNILTNAKWSRTSFTSLHIAGVIFNGILEDCSFENCVFLKVKFQNVNLFNTFFKCKKLTNIEFIDCQADRLTYEFLKNGKANLSGIRLLNE